MLCYCRRDGRASWSCPVAPTVQSASPAHANEQMNAAAASSGGADQEAVVLHMASSTPLQRRLQKRNSLDLEHCGPLPKSLPVSLFPSNVDDSAAASSQQVGRRLDRRLSVHDSVASDATIRPANTVERNAKRLRVQKSDETCVEELFATPPKRCLVEPYSSPRHESAEDLATGLDAETAKHEEAQAALLVRAQALLVRWDLPKSDLRSEYCIARMKSDKACKFRQCALRHKSQGLCWNHMKKGCAGYGVFGGELPLERVEELERLEMRCGGGAPAASQAGARSQVDAEHVTIDVRSDVSLKRLRSARGSEPRRNTAPLSATALVDAAYDCDKEPQGAPCSSPQRRSEHPAVDSSGLVPDAAVERVANVGGGSSSLATADPCVLSEDVRSDRRAVAALAAEQRASRVFASRNLQLGRPQRSGRLALDVLAALQASKRAAELDISIEGAVSSRRADQGSKWEVLLSSLPSLLYEGLLGALRAEYQGQATDILSSSWSQDWVGWDELQERVSVFIAEAGEECLMEERVLECVMRTLRAHLRAAVQNKGVDSASDTARIAQLRSIGLLRGRGEVFRANQCLADSLLQLLMHLGFLSPSITMEARRVACAENRRQLTMGPADLRPRNRDPFSSSDYGEDPRAFLQHDIHAEVTIRFFMDWFAARGQQLREIPPAGILLTVRSRFDSDILPPDRMRICATDAAGDGGAAEFQLYNLTGEGISGTHYDPLFPCEVLDLD